MAFFDDRTTHDGDPPASGGRASLGIFTEDLGPLPVWGWAAVVIAAVFFWRKLHPSSSSSSQQSTPYPPGSGSVVVIPSAAGPTAPGGGIASSADVGTAYSYEQKLIDQMATTIYQEGPGSVAPSLAGASLYNFSDGMAMARNQAAYLLGLPYVNGGGSLVNPGTGQTLPLSTFQNLAGSNASQFEAISLGRADAWNAVLTGTPGAGSSPGAAAPVSTVTPVLPGSAITPAPPTPRYPSYAPLPAGTCPAGLVLEVGASGWTCATTAEHQALLAFLAAKAGH